jgi:hypothetical protein
MLFVARPILSKTSSELFLTHIRDQYLNGHDPFSQTEGIGPDKDQ